MKINIIDTIKNLFGSKQIAPTNSVSYGQDIYEAFGVTPSASGTSVNAVSAMRVAAVYACVNKIAGTISTLPLHIYKTDGDIKSRLPRDELWYQLNEQPSSQYTAASHWEGVSIAQLLRGDGFSWIRRNLTGRIVEILPLPWGSVTPFRQPDGTVRYYINLPEINIITWLDPADVLHFPGFGFDGLRSMSVITHAARTAVGNALAMDEYAGKFFAGGAHPSIILTAENKMDPAQIELLKQAFASKYSGLENAHKLPLVLTEGVKAEPISISAEDSQLLEARKFQVLDIARAFGVPPHMIGETSANTSWGSGIESLNRAFVTHTLKQHLVRIEQELNRKLYPKKSTTFIKFDLEALIEGDSVAQSTYYRAALGGPGTGAGWLTPDEVRKKSGDKPFNGLAGQLYDPRIQTEGRPNE